MSLRKAAEMALGALETYWLGENAGKDGFNAIQALRQTLAQPDEVLAEREACARLCDLQCESLALSQLEKYRARFIADAIRARSEK